VALPPRALRLGVSQCLLGDSVRYDGGHERNHFVADRLAPLVEWVGVCPEFDAGMGVPRPAIELRGAVDRPRICEVESGRDLTNSFAGWCAERAAALGRQQLDGFVLKSDSPSCGLRDVPIHDGGRIAASGHGLFVRALESVDPTLPLCRQDDLQDEALRRHFFLRALSRQRARTISVKAEFSATADDPLATQFLSDHRLALTARGIAWGDAQRAWSAFDSWNRAQDWLARQIAIPETLEGNLEALTQSVEWLDGLDSSHWFALAPMIEEVRRTSMLPQVMRVTLHLMARCHQSARLARQFYLHPWLCDGPDLRIAIHAPKRWPTL
jgi:uncharacterized protein YbbK (DUF523 family)